MKNLVKYLDRLAATTILVLLLTATGLSAAVTVYPKYDYPGFSYDVPCYTMTVDGQAVPIRNYNPRGGDEEYRKELPIYRQHKGEEEYRKSKAAQAVDSRRNREYYYAHFGISGGASTIEIDAKEVIVDCVIRPQAYGIKAVVSGTKVTFTLDRSRYLSVEINDRKDLFILADPNETDRPAASGVDPVSGKAVFNVTAKPYLADPTGRQPATEALNQAIKDAAESPRGGIVYVPRGYYVIHRIALMSNVWLYLAPGAALIADPDPRKWRLGMKPDVLIGCRDVANGKVYGRGVIYLRTTAINQRVADLNGSEPAAAKKMENLRLRPFDIKGVKNFTIDGVLVNESSAWTIYIQGGAGITITNAKVLNDKYTGTNDGINCGGGSDITVRHCFVSTLDDAVCLKGYMGQVSNVLIEDVVSDSARSAIKFGLQASKPVVDITVRNLQGIRGGKGFDICHDAGQEDYRNIHIIDSAFSRCDGWPLRVTIRDKNSKGAWPRGVGSVVGLKLERVSFELSDPENGKMSFSGYDADNVVRDLVFVDVTINGQVLTAAHFAPAGRVDVGPYVQNITVQGQPVPIPAWPPAKQGKEKDPPPSKSRAGKAWEEAHGGVGKSPLRATGPTAGGLPPVDPTVEEVPTPVEQP